MEQIKNFSDPDESEKKHALLSVLEGWLFSRVCLLLTAWFAPHFAGNPTYTRYLERGFFLTPKQLLDIWCRWDSEWYFSIVKYGYVPAADLSAGYSNLAFFPLYPWLIRGLTFWLPAAHREGLAIFLGLLISNLAYIAALYGIWRLARLFFDEETSSRSVILYLCLPCAFFFTAFYTEGLFLCLSVYAVFFAERKKWFLSAGLMALAALTRPHGALLLIPVFIIYLRSCGWKWSNLDWRGVSFLLVPAAVAGHFYYLYTLTGDYFAFFKAMSAWGRSVHAASPAAWLADFLSPLKGNHAQPAAVDLALILFALIVSILMLLRLRQKEFGWYSLASVLVLLSSGVLLSLSRYVSVIFPVWIYAAGRIKNKKIFYGLCALMILFQTIFFIGWVRFYWVD